MSSSSIATPQKAARSDPEGEGSVALTDPVGSSLVAAATSVEKKQPDPDETMSTGVVPITNGLAKSETDTHHSPAALPVSFDPSTDSGGLPTSITPTGAADAGASPADAPIAAKALSLSAKEESPTPVRSGLLGNKRGREEIKSSPGGKEEEEADDDDDDDEFGDDSGTKFRPSSARSSRVSSKRSSGSNNLLAKFLDANDWWETLDGKHGHLDGVGPRADKALQMVLWDLGFEYNVYAHQFEAVRFVAGLVPEFPLVDDTGKTLFQRNEAGASARLETVVSAAKEFARWHGTHKSDSSNGNGNGCDSDWDWDCVDAEGKPCKYILPTPGMLLADEMGLGKTVETLAGAALRNAMARYSNLLGTPVLPTLIVTPQDGILNQWYETLVRSGVPPSRITVMGDTKKQVQKRRDGCEPSLGGSRKQGGSFVLCTRYKIQSELKHLFNCHETDTVTNQRNKKARLSRNNKQWRTTAAKHRSTCIDLFPHVSQDLIGNLRNQYRADKGKESNRHKTKGETATDCVARLVRQSRTLHVQNQARKGQSQKFAFQTIVVDEAHFCKNVLAFWGLGLALLGSQSKRTVLLTGTPYNNGPADMSALMTYIDPSHPSARIEWWDEAVQGDTNEKFRRLREEDTAEKIHAVSEWRKAFMMRRTKDVLEKKLPRRHRVETNVGAHPSELWIYEAYEGKFLMALNNLQKYLDNDGPEARHKRKKVFEIMMACMACMRMSLVHPVLPGGREVSIHFSPSRRHLLKREERPKRCVLCNSAPTEVAEKAAAAAAAGNKPERKPGKTDTDDDQGLMILAGSGRAEMDLDDDALNDDDDEEFEDDLDAKSKRERELEEKRKGPIVPLGPDLCQASDSECRHFAHEKCIETLLEDLGPAASCPKCHDLQSRMHQNLRHRSYCENIATHIRGAPGGFLSSTKIEEAIQWFKTVPKDEKAIILSFFKGSLDLIEGILTTTYGIECARYDGDVDKEVRTRDLEKFKTKSSCRVLLATVQSGGTGLNITEANHVCFLDRWFNPCVHDQAESRCHRIGQEKEVKIAYLDTNHTVDVVMKRINLLKEGNASVILADGTSLGDRWSLGYRNISGVIGNTLKALQMMRQEVVSKNGDAPLPPHDDSELEEKIQNMTAGKPSRDTEEPEKKDKPEANRSDDEDDSEEEDDDDEILLIGQPKTDRFAPFTVGEYLSQRRPNEDINAFWRRVYPTLKHPDVKPSPYMAPSKETMKMKLKNISSRKHLERKSLSFMNPYLQTMQTKSKDIFSLRATAFNRFEGAETPCKLRNRKEQIKPLPHIPPHLKMMKVPNPFLEVGKGKTTASKHHAGLSLSDDDDSDDDFLLNVKSIFGSRKRK